MVDNKIPLEELKKTADAGDVEAQKAVALLSELGLHTGLSSAPDWPTARKYWQKAAEQGDPMAQFSFGAILAKGLDGAPPDKDAAAGWFAKSKAAGFSQTDQKIAEFQREVSKQKVGGVLILDDSKSSRLVMSGILKAAGFLVFEAETVKDAIDKLDANWNISLVFSESSLGGGKPFEGIEKITKRFPAIPIIVTASHSIAEQVKQAKTFGVRGWLVKPVNPETLQVHAKKFSRTAD